MKKFTLAILGLCLGFSPAVAQDVYVYSSSSPTAVTAQDSVQRIEFGDDAINIVTTSGGQQSVSLTDFDYFLLYNKDIVNSVSPAIAAQGLNFSYDGARVNVSSSERISQIDIFSADGAKCASFAPYSTSFTAAVDSYSAGVYIVKAVAGKSSESFKFIKK